MYSFSDFDFLWHEKLADGLWRVVEDWGGPQKICIYVVEGRERVAVIDSGCGATPALRDYIAHHITTQKPMICLLTHTHPDHSGGCTLFDAQYVHREELEQLAWNLNDERRVHDAAAFAYTGVPGSKAHGSLERALAVGEYCKERYIRTDWRNIPWRFVSDGDVIDLGGTRLECIYMNAHGTMIYYNREKDYALCGDNFTYTLALGDVDDTLIRKFEALAGKTTDKTLFYSGHLYYEDLVTRPEEITGWHLKELLRVMKVLQAGGSFAEDLPEIWFETPGAPTLMGYAPETQDPDVWAAFELKNRARKKIHQKNGTKYIHKIGSVLLTYMK